MKKSIKMKYILFFLFIGTTLTAKSQNILPYVFGREEAAIIIDIKKNYKGLKYYARDNYDNGNVMLMYTTASKDVGSMSIALHFKNDKCYEYVYLIDKDKFDYVIESISTNPMLKKVQYEDLTWVDWYSGRKTKITTTDKYISISYTEK